MENRHVLNLDFKQRSIFNVKFVQGDINSNVLEFHITSGGIPVDISNQEITVAFYKPDGTLVIQDNLTGVSIVDALSGKVQCILSVNTLAVVGIVKGEVDFSTEGTKLSTAQFTFNVTESLDNGDVMSVYAIPKLDAKIVDIQSQYNDDSTQWGSDVNNVIAQASVKIAETETARQAAITATTNANVAATATNAAITTVNAASESTKLNWKAPVATFAALATTYPAAVKGDCAQVTGENKWYKYSGTMWEYRGDFSLTGYESITNVLSEAAYQAKFRQSQMHSGCITLPVIIGSTSTLNQVTIPAADYNINGYIVSMPQTVVILDAPPTTGTREDLIFLEAYFPTNDPYKMVGRYRSVAGVDFSKYPEGFTDLSGLLGIDWVNVNHIVTPQGGNNIAITASNSYNALFVDYKMRVGIVPAPKIALNDVGLYTAGDGTTTAKTTLQTYDGYSYAIPLLRVKRRNSGGFSRSNPNGARGYTTAISVVTGTYDGTVVLPSTDITITFMTDVSSTFKVGDLLMRQRNDIPLGYIKTVSGATLTFTPEFNGLSAGYTMKLNNETFYAKSDHPQSLYSNVIDPRDVIDLRHRTQVQYNYDYELRKASDQFMRGEIGSQKKLMKVYHGIPKSEIDEHTVFYASLDGTTVPEFPVGSSAMNLGTGSFKPMPTGSGYKFNGDSATPVVVSGLNQDTGSIDLLLDVQSLKNETNLLSTFAGILTSENGWMFGIVYDKLNNQIYCRENYTDGSINSCNRYTPDLYKQNYLHIRLSWDATNFYFSVNGTLQTTRVRASSTLRCIPAKVSLGAYGVTSTTMSKSTISDVHISNIDRGSLFPNLPPDFISGDAVIMPAHTDQRKINSEAQMSQTTVGIAKGAGTGHNRGITTTQATPGAWASGDTIKVTGMAGELISGIFDTDTALAKVVKYIDVNHLQVDDVSKLSVGDTFNIRSSSDISVSWNTGRTISDIDTNTKIVTSSGLNSSMSTGDLIVETTASSSVPLTNFLNATTKTPVAGTWANLGTNQATFTLGTNATLTNQDIQLDYSIIMPAGQPALTAPTTATLLGEAGFRVPYDKQTITSDFAGKVSASTWVSPNVAKTLSAIVANNPAPSAFVNELATSEYAKMYTQDGTITTFSTSVNGEQACVLLSFDLIKIAERKLGCKIPRKTKADKVDWLKRNLSSFISSCWCYGSSPTGNKATLKARKVDTSEWAGNVANTTNGSVTKISSPVTVPNYYINLDGFVHFLAYADPSDGVTPSVINVDYASLDIKFADKVTNSFKLVTGQTVHIRDDFAGKISGSVVENPNKVFRGGNSTLYTPTSQNDSLSQSEVDLLKTIDGFLSSRSGITNLEISQQLFSFNLIRIYEDKYGPIPALDKVQWLKDNLTSITCNWWGYGSGPSGNKAQVQYWAGNAWTAYNSPITTNGVSKWSTLSTSFLDKIDINGFFHALAYADPSDGTTASTIYTDYVNIELTLKAAPTGYDQLVPDNPRRDAGLSQILAIRKETKEVQSLFPVPTDLNLASYSEYLPAPDPIAANTDVTILAEIPEFLITDLGSTVGMKQGTHHWMNPAYRVGQDKLELYGEFGFSSVPFAPDSVGINVGAKVVMTSTGFGNYSTVQVGLMSIPKPLVSVARYLVLVNGAIKILIISRYKTDGNLSIVTATTILCDIIGKPLSKELDGINRLPVTPTYWKTNPLVLEGFVDKATNKLITTNNSI